MDMLSCYWQVALKPHDKEKTAFYSGSGLYQFKVMPMGLTPPLYVPKTDGASSVWSPKEGLFDLLGRCISLLSTVAFTDVVNHEDQHIHADRPFQKVTEDYGLFDPLCEPIPTSGLACYHCS